MSLGGAVFALTAAQAVNSISSGYAQKAEAGYNATLYEGRANLIQANADLQAGQYDRAIGQNMSRSMVTVAGQGLAPQGSVMAHIIDTQEQMQIDKAIAQGNMQMEKNYATQTASAYRRQGSLAVRGGYVGAFSDILTGAVQYAAYKNNPLKTTFDVSSKQGTYGFGGSTAKYTVPKKVYNLR